MPALPGITLSPSRGPGIAALPTWRIVLLAQQSGSARYPVIASAAKQSRAGRRRASDSGLLRSARNCLLQLGYCIGIRGLRMRRAGFAAQHGVRPDVTVSQSGLTPAVIMVLRLQACNA